MVGLVWIVAIDLSNLLVEEVVDLQTVSMAVVAGAIAWLIVPRQPRNGAVWPFAIVTFTAGLYCLLSAWMYHQLLDLGLDLSSSNLDFVYALSPSDLPTQIATVLMMVSWLFIPFCSPHHCGPSAVSRWSSSFPAMAMDRLGRLRRGDRAVGDCRLHVPAVVDALI